MKEKIKVHVLSIVMSVVCAVTAAVFAASCSSDDDVMYSAVDGVECDDSLQELVVTAYASYSNSTRAYDATWEAGDVIGITGTCGDITFDNVPYVTLNGDGVFEPVDETIYFSDDDDVTFTAYYPYDEDVSSDDPDISFSLPGGADYMWSQATGSKASPEVEFEFSHLMAKIVIILSPSNGVSYDDVCGYYIHYGLGALSCTFDTSAGDITVPRMANVGVAGLNVNENAYDIAYENNESVTYSLITPPDVSFSLMGISENKTDEEGEYLWSLDLDWEEINASFGDDDPADTPVGGRAYEFYFEITNEELSSKQEDL